MNTTPHEGESLFGKHGLPGTSDTREAQSQALRGACAQLRDPCTSGWDSDACPHWPLGSWSIFVPMTCKRRKTKNKCVWPPLMFNGALVGNLVDGYSWRENSVSQLLLLSSLNTTNDFPGVYIFWLVISSCWVCLPICKIGVIPLPFRWLWRFYKVFKCPNVLSGI